MKYINIPQYYFQIFLLFRLENMDIRILHESALHIQSFRSLNMKQFPISYFLRFHFYSKNSRQNIYSTPTTILHANQNQIYQGQIIEHFYLSQTFKVQNFKNEKIFFEELCVFRTQFDFSILQGKSQSRFFMVCQLMAVDPNNHNFVITCSKYESEIKNIFCGAQFLNIVFQQTQFSACVKGSIHFIVYRSDIKDKKDERILKSIVLNEQNKIREYFSPRNRIESTNYEKKNIENFRSPVKINKNNQNTNSRVSLKNSSSIKCPQLKQTFQYLTTLIKQQQTNIQLLYKKYIQILEKSTYINSQKLKQMQQCLIHENRKKIFDPNTLEIFQDRMNKAANKIFLIWTKLIKLICNISQLLLPSLEQQYRIKIKDKWEESVIRHQIKISDWTKQKYNNSLSEHQLIARTLRNSFSQQINLKIINKNLFPSQKLKPIMFQQIYLKPSQNIQKPLAKSLIGKHLIIFVHGFGATRYQMQKMTNIIKQLYYDTDCYISISNQGKTDNSIQEMAQTLSKQVENYIISLKKLPSRISFIGHSMGGIIIKSAIPKLRKYSDRFYTYLSLSSPHLGYLYNSSTLINAGLWLINNMKNWRSINQLMMQDNQNIRETFLYKLSSEKVLSYFQNIVLVSSFQDLYVPSESAKIVKNEQVISDVRNGVEKGKIYEQMIQNIILNIKSNKLHRIDINFQIPQQSFDKLVGRTAHIKFVNCKHFLRMLITSCELFFK